MPSSMTHQRSRLTRSRKPTSREVIPRTTQIVLARDSWNVEQVAARLQRSRMAASPAMKPDNACAACGPSSDSGGLGCDQRTPDGDPRYVVVGGESASRCCWCTTSIRFRLRTAILYGDGYREEGGDSGSALSRRSPLAEGTQPEWVCRMKRKPEKTGMTSGGAVSSLPGRVAMSLVRCTRPPVAARGRDGTAVSKRAPNICARARSQYRSLATHLAGCLVGCRTCLARTSCRIRITAERISASRAPSVRVATSGQPGLHRAMETSVRHLWLTLPLQQEP